MNFQLNEKLTKKTTTCVVPEVHISSTNARERKSFVTDSKMTVVFSYIQKFQTDTSRVNWQSRIRNKLKTSIYKNRTKTMCTDANRDPIKVYTISLRVLIKIYSTNYLTRFYSTYLQNIIKIGHPILLLLLKWLRFKACNEAQNKPSLP